MTEILRPGHGEPAANMSEALASMRADVTRALGRPCPVRGGPEREEYLRGLARLLLAESRGEHCGPLGNEAAA